MTISMSCMLSEISYQMCQDTQHAHVWSTVQLIQHFCTNRQDKALNVALVSWKQICLHITYINKISFFGNCCLREVQTWYNYIMRALMEVHQFAFMSITEFLISKHVEKSWVSRNQPGILTLLHEATLKASVFQRWRNFKAACYLWGMLAVRRTKASQPLNKSWISIWLCDLYHFEGGTIKTHRHKNIVFCFVEFDEMFSSALLRMRKVASRV